MSLAAQAIAMGMSPAHVATAKNKKQLQFMIQNYQPAPAPPPAPPPQPQRVQYKPPVTRQPNASLAQTQQGIKSPRKPQRRGNISQFLISLAQANQVGAGAGSPLNIG